MEVDPLTINVKPETKTLTTFANIDNGKVIGLRCDEGYVVKGTNHLKCWNSEFTTNDLPECIPAPCILPVIPNANYQGGYRSGLTIVHGSSVSVQCDTVSNLVNMHCNLGSLTPLTINCENNPQKKIRENYSETIDPSNLLNTDYSLNLVGRDCGPPERIQGSLIYRNPDDPSDRYHGFPTGTEILFNCISSGVGERSTWKIVCEDGLWIGKSFNCGMFSIIFFFEIHF